MGVFFLLFTLIHATNSQTPKIDSLNRELQNELLSDIDRIDLHNNIGFEYWIIDPNESIKHGNLALSLSLKTDHLPGKANANRIIGVAHWAAGNYEPALNHLYSSQNDFQKLSDSLGIANCILNIGMVYADQNDQESALRNYEIANEYFEKLGDESRMATTYTKMADIYIHQNDFDKALEILKKSYKIHKKADFTYGKAESLNRLGLLYRAMGKYEEGIIHLKIAAQFSESINDLDGLAKSYENIASIYILLNQHLEALPFVQKAEETALASGSIKWLPNIYFDLKEIEVARGNYRKAIDYYDKYVSFKDSIFNEKVAQDIANLHSRIEAEKHEAQLQLDRQEIELLEQKSRINLLMAVSGGTLLVLLITITFLIMRTQKLRIIRDKKRSELEQKKLHREIEAKSQELTAYTVNFIRKNEILDELKEEIEQISTTPDDDLLKKVRRLAKIINSHAQVDKDWEDFKLHFESVHKDFFYKLKAENESLTSNDLKLCALIRLNLTMKEMGQMLGISAESVKTARYRLRKKLNLNHEESLNDYLIKLDSVTVG